jgi:predicted nucleotidyltransferase
MQPKLVELRRQHRVKRLSLFGSAARGDFRPGCSDFDFTVEFESLPPGEHAHAYFCLWEGLSELLGAPVDLVEVAAIENPYFRREIETTQQQIYGP